MLPRNPAPRATTSDGAGGVRGEHNIKQKARNPLLHATSREPFIVFFQLSGQRKSESNEWKIERQHQILQEVIQRWK